MKTSPPSGYGFHRVKKSTQILPLAADQLDATPLLKSDEELVLDVELLQLDATSMKEIREASHGDLASMKSRILHIVETRGKMHNPVTNSGGVLVGRIREEGRRFFERHSRPAGIQSGTSVIPVASLTSLPLHLESIESIALDQVRVRGTAVAFSCMRICPVPEDLGAALTLSCVDISSLVPQLRRNLISCGRFAS